jgi:hypothetical protein
MDFGSEAAHGGGRGGVDLEAEAGGEADSAQQAQMILGKATGRVADRADETGVEIGEATDMVDNGLPKILG